MEKSWKITLLKYPKSSVRCMEAGSLFQISGPATSNDLSLSRVLVHDTTHDSDSDSDSAADELRTTDTHLTATMQCRDVSLKYLLIFETRWSPRTFGFEKFHSNVLQIFTETFWRQLVNLDTKTATNLQSRFQDSLCELV